MRVVVPFAAERPKTRLDGVLTPAERIAFSRTMLADVLDALCETGHDPEVLATAPLDRVPADAPSFSPASPEPDESSPLASVPVRIDDRTLTPAVNAVLGDADDPVAVVMADLALATPAALTRAFAAEAEVVLAPGRGGGTNVLISRHPDFRVDYHGASYFDHLANAREVGASVEPIDSFRLACDVDEPADLAEVLVHGEGRAARWLRAAGFSLVVGDGRIAAERTDVP